MVVIDPKTEKLEFKPTVDKEWLKSKAEEEDGMDCSVGSFDEVMEKMGAVRVRKRGEKTPEEFAAMTTSEKQAYMRKLK